MPIRDAQRSVAARAPERREAVMRATIELLAEGGPNAVTHRAVAERAGLANGAVAYYFASRADLLDATLRDLARSEQDLFKSALDSLPTQPSRVPAALAGILADRLIHAPSATLARYELFVEAARRSDLRPVLEDWRDAYHRLIAEMLRRAGSDRPQADAPLLLDALNGTLLALVAVNDAGTAQKRLELMISRFLAEGPSPDGRSIRPS